MQLQPLLATYGTTQRPGRAYYPFWRLQNDGIYQVPEEGELVPNEAGDVSVRDLRHSTARGGLTEDVAEALVVDPQLAREVTGMLLDGSFPPSLHEEILDATAQVLHIELRTVVIFLDGLSYDDASGQITSEHQHLDQAALDGMTLP